MPEHKYVDAQTVVKGLRVRELPEGYMPIEGVFMVKCMSPDGEISWVNRYTEGAHQIEFLGAVTSIKHLLQAEVLRMYEPDEGDDDNG